MDTYLAIASVRVVREYSDKPITDEAVHHILEAGRATGSSVNKQEWKFYVARDKARLGQLSETVYAPGNVQNAQVAIGIVTTSGNRFDIGRCAQNMILAAWDAGIGSVPNGVRQLEEANRLLNIASGEQLEAILSLGYPARPYHPKADDVEGILQRINRKPLDELVVWVE